MDGAKIERTNRQREKKEKEHKRERASECEERKQKQPSEREVSWKGGCQDLEDLLPSLLFLPPHILTLTRMLSSLEVSSPARARRKMIPAAKLKTERKPSSALHQITDNAHVRAMPDGVILISSTDEIAKKEGRYHHYSALNKL